MVYLERGVLESEGGRGLEAKISAYREGVNKIDGACVFIDKDNRILAVNYGFLYLLGYDPKFDTRKLEGTDYTLLVKGDPQVTYLYFHNKERIIPERIDVRRKDGKYIPVIIEGELKEFPISYINERGEEETCNDIISVVKLRKSFLFSRADSGFKKFQKQMEKEARKSRRTKPT